MVVPYRRLTGRAAAVVVVLAVAACGGQVAGPPGPAGRSSSATAAAEPTVTPSVTALFAQARAAALAAPSAHLTGSIISGGVSASLDIVGTLDGSNQVLTLAIAGRGTMTARSVAGAVYVKGDTTFWDKAYGPGKGAAIGARWVRLTAADAQDLAVTSIQSLLTSMFATDALGALDSAATTVSVGTVDGATVFRLVGSGAGRTELDVTADGQARLVRSVTTGGSPGELRFSDWGRAPRVAAPSPSQLTAL